MAIGAVGLPSVSPATSGISPANPTSSGSSQFGNLIERLLGDVGQKQGDVDNAVQALATGNVENIHNVMLSVVKADLSFRMVLEIRNKLMEAYQEVMRMQV